MYVLSTSHLFCIVLKIFKLYLYVDKFLYVDNIYMLIKQKTEI